MNKVEFLFVLFGLFCINSCADTIVQYVPDLDVKPQNDFTIPIDNALSSLETFLIEDGILKTKSGLSAIIENYFTISNSETKTSGSVGDVLYAVNFKDEGGYALLSADSRIPEEIIAVTECGSVTESDFDETEWVKRLSDI